LAGRRHIEKEGEGGEEYAAYKHSPGAKRQQEARVEQALLSSR
jgi:hypothetical protein